MAIRRLTINGRCIEQKGYYGYDPNGNYGFIATSGNYPCGTWTFKQSANDMPTIGNRQRLVAANDARSADEPVVIATDNRTIFGDVEDREAPYVDSKTNVVDAEGNIVDNLDNEQNSTAKKSSGRFILIALAVVAVVLILKSK